MPDLCVYPPVTSMKKNTSRNTVCIKMSEYAENSSDGFQVLLVHVRNLSIRGV